MRLAECEHCGRGSVEGGHEPLVSSRLVSSRRLIALACVALSTAACAPDDAPEQSEPGRVVEHLVEAAPATPPTGEACEAPFMSCMGLCIDAANDEFNCGQCGLECGHGFCRGGVCMLPGGRRRDTGPVVIRHRPRRGDPLTVDRCVDGTPTSQGTPFFSASPFGIHLPTQTVIHSIVNAPGSRVYQLYAHDARGGHWRLLGQPPHPGPLTGLFTVWGVAGADFSQPPPVSPLPILGQVYVLSYESGLSNHLAAYTYRADGGSGWESGFAPDPPQGQGIYNEPSLSATWNPNDGNLGMVYVAVRTIESGTGAAHMSLWYFPPVLNALASAQVTDITRTFSGPRLDYNTPISMDVPRNGAQGFRLAAITDDGKLAVFSGTGTSGYWTVTPPVGDRLPPGGVLLPTGLQLRVADGETHVTASLLVEGQVRLVSWTPAAGFDDLMTQCGALPADPEIGNLYDARAPYASATETLYYTSSGDAHLQTCSEPFASSCTCSPVERGAPRDAGYGTRTGFWSDDVTSRLYFVGALGLETTYRYAYDFGPIWGERSRWTNFLAPRSGYVTLAPPFTGRLDISPHLAMHVEPMMAEWFGRLVAVSSNLYSPKTHDVFESADDGNCWSSRAGESSPFPANNAQGDESVAFDGSGRAFVTALVGPFASPEAHLFLTSSPSVGDWPPAETCTGSSSGRCYDISAIPSIQATLTNASGERLVMDRPQLVADRNAVNSLFLTYVAASTTVPVVTRPGYLTYCAAGCDTGATARWCTPIQLPSADCGGGNPDLTGAGCLPVVTSSGQVFVTVNQDRDCIAACNPVTGVRGDYPDAVGIRRIMGGFTTACRATINPRPDACFCYVANFSGSGTSESPEALSRSANGANGAAFQRSWNFGIEASGDNDAIAVSVRSITDSDNPARGCGDVTSRDLCRAFAHA